MFTRYDVIECIALPPEPHRDVFKLGALYTCEAYWSTGSFLDDAELGWGFFHEDVIEVMEQPRRCLIGEEMKVGWNPAYFRPRHRRNPELLRRLLKGALQAA